MKFIAALLSFVTVASASTQMHELKDIKASSELGMNLLSKARRLADQADVDFTWVADFSIKFQGCTQVAQWNADAEGDEDVKIVSKRLIRFRLCPTSSCTATNAGGCNSGYGDYIIDMNTYLDSYFEAVKNYNEYMCESLAQGTCICEDDGSDDFDEEKCQYDCYKAQGVADICTDKNPYEDDEQQQEAFELQEYMECAKWENKNRRQLNDQEVKYYMGPYCAEQGGAIFLGLFTDEDCSVFADSNGGTDTYLATAGVSMPYGAESVIGMDCVSCKEPADNNEDGNDADDGDQVIEMCEQIYQMAGKCEKNLGSYSSNSNACTYIDGIKVIRKNGVVEAKAASANKTASVFIGLFVVAFVLLAAYVYYLRTKLDRASITLSE